MCTCNEFICEKDSGAPRSQAKKKKKENEREKHAKFVMNVVPALASRFIENEMRKPHGWGFALPSAGYNKLA